MYRRARSDLKAALADLAERGVALAQARYVKTHRGTLIEAARRVRAESIDIVTLAVLSERAAGASWTDVAQALMLEERYVREHYEPIEERWLAGEGLDPIVLQPRGGQPLRLVSG